MTMERLLAPPRHLRPRLLLDPDAGHRIGRMLRAEAGGGAAWILDLSALAGVEEEGLMVLREVAAELAARDGVLVLCGPCPDVESLLERTGLAEDLPLARDGEAAREILAALRAG